MNKYELALVVNAKIEDDVRTATVERAKEYITRAGGTVTEVEEWGKKKLAYDIQKMSDGFYYFTATVPEYDRIELRRAPTVAGLATAEPKTIWTKHPTGPMGAHIWAPELHHIDGKWFIYFAAGAAEKIWDIHIYVLENAAANPLEGERIERGQLRTKWETFALDATTFEHRSVRYLVWAQRDPSAKNSS